MPDEQYATTDRRGFNVSRLPTYTLTDGAGTQYRVTFDRVDLPTYSHRVIIDRGGTGGFEKIATDWLSDEAKPNGDAAVYFATKHGAVKPSDSLATA
jgi:hypothetical protein